VEIFTYISAAIMGLVEGLTEFLPVSSTGHLIIVGDLMGFRGPTGHVFEIVIQLAAILAVVWIYRATLIDTVLKMYRPGPEQRLAINLVVSFLPAMVIGFLLHDFIKGMLFNPVVVAVALVVGGVVILLIEKYKPMPATFGVERISVKTALLIGCAQVVAMIPGVSRSGATIMGALLCKVDRKTATEYSFFLAIPTMFAATLYDGYKNRDSLLAADGLEVTAIGFVVAFVSAMVVVKWLLRFVQTHDFKVFAYYRIAAGLLMFALLAR
jgi:undecaprenyl-diphosphatase